MRKVLSMGLLVSAMIASAHASLIVTRGTLKYFYPGEATLFFTDNFIATNSVEVICTGSDTGNASVCGVLTAPDQRPDIQGSAITDSYSIDFDGFAFQNPAHGNGISGVTLSSGISGVGASRITFTSDSVKVNMESVVVSGLGRLFTLSLLPEITERIPEPGSFLLVLGALPLVLRRRK